jgi:hypothetical protein
MSTHFFARAILMAAFSPLALSVYADKGTLEPDNSSCLTEAHVVSTKQVDTSVTLLMIVLNA